jgi:hypothetical protein
MWDTPKPRTVGFMKESPIGQRLAVFHVFRWDSLMWRGTLALDITGEERE